MPQRDRRHGYNEDDETRALLRSPPSTTALAWASERTGAAVERWQVLRGGMSSAIYLVTFVGSEPRELVLRCYVRRDPTRTTPSRTALREAAALRTVASVDVPTPEVVAIDADGSQAGVPAVLMTRLRGRVVWDPGDGERWVHRLAEVLPAIHAAEVGDDAIGPYYNYVQQSYAPPPWIRRPAVWERAVEVFHGPILEHDRCFIHRDYHPGNVLWTRNRVTGVVDWQSGCVGPPSVDIGHCRANLLGYAPDLAEPYTRRAERALGITFHPWADIAALVGMVDGLRGSPPDTAGCEAIEAAIERAVLEITGG